MTSVPELIHWSFSKKPENLIEITKHFGEAQQDLFKLLEILKLIELSRCRSFLNLQDKLVGESSNWRRFLAFGSELFFANEFLKQGFSVELILESDKHWAKPTRRPPDFFVLKDEKKFLIEVASIAGDETTSEVANYIRPLIEKSSFCVDIQYTEDFSFPVIKFNEREERQRLVKAFVNEFEKVFETLDSTTILPQSCDILECRVTFTKTFDSKQGHYAGHGTDLFSIPEDKLYQHIESVIEDKAQKRETWAEFKKEIPYLIALDIQQGFTFAERLSFRLSNTPRREVISKNVTGIITKIRDELHYLPNPFAEEPINSLDIHAMVPWKRAMC